jgi:hypothetical protein
MRKYIFLIGLSIYCWQHVSAQDNERFRVSSEEEIEQAIPASDRYLLEQFQQGTVSLHNGTKANARLNYNLLLEEIQFIDITGDTMALADEHLVKQISIDDKIFYYGEQSGFVETIADYSPVKLAIHQKFATINAEKMGAYEQSSAVSSIRTYKSFTTNTGQRQNLKLKGDLVLAIESAFYFVDQNNRTYKANKSALRKIFPEKKNIIRDFVKEEKIDFNKEEDLRKLLQYCSELFS